MNYVFITGAAGFIGKQITQKFVDEDWHVIALIHQSKSTALEILARNNKVTLIEGDICKPEFFKKTLSNFLTTNKIKLQAIVHAAAYVSDVGRRKKFEQHNFIATKNLVDLVTLLAVDKFIFISTTDVYGIKNFHGEREDKLPYCNNRKNNYPKYKICSEQWIQNHLAQDKYVIIRPAAVWGIDDKTLTLRIVNFLKWSPCIVHFGKWRGTNRWPLAHVKNVATAAFLATTKDEALGRAINVLDREKVSMDNFYMALASIFLPNKTFFKVYIPIPIIKPISKIISFISNLLNLRHPFIDPSDYALHSVSSNLDFSNEYFVHLAEQSGQKIITYQEGLAELNTYNL